MAHDVFISYSAKDRHAAEVACTFLEREGVVCWIAPRDASAGEPWAAALVEAIQASRVMLLVYTGRSNGSEHVLREVTAAADAGVPILPVRLEDVPPSKELGYYIRRAHWLEAMEGPFEAHLPALLGAVRRLLAGPTAGGASTGAAGQGPPPRRSALARTLGSGRGRTLAVGGLALVALGGAALLWMRRPATLSLETEPADATATVDGAAVGATPLALSVSSGPHGVVLRRPGFKEWSKVVDVSAGEKASFSLQLVVADPRDAAAVNLLGRSLGVALQGFTLPEAQRGGAEGEPLELLLPRGEVRPTDLSRLFMDADPERIEPSGVVGLRRGDTMLWETPFLPQNARYEVDVPEAVRDVLRPGDALVWGWWPKEGPPVTLPLRIAAGDLGPLLGDIERRLVAQPEGVRRHVRAQAFLDRGLFTAAFGEARALARDDPGDVRALAVMEQALVKLDGGRLRFVDHLRAAIRNAPEADRAKVFGGAPAAAGR